MFLVGGTRSVRQAGRTTPSLVQTTDNRQLLTGVEATESQEEDATGNNKTHGDTDESVASDPVCNLSLPHPNSSHTPSTSLYNLNGPAL